MLYSGCWMRVEMDLSVTGEWQCVTVTEWPWLVARNSSSTEPSAQECLQLVVRATQVFREEYVQKFEQAREEIARRY